jgi:hypothetical protein
LTGLPDLPERLAQLGEAIEDVHGRLTTKPHEGDPRHIAFTIPHQQQGEDSHGRG